MRTILLVVCSLLVCVPALRQQGAAKAELNGDDYTVYSVVINSSYARDGIERIVVGDHTSMDLPPVMMGMTRPGDSPELKKIREAKDTTEDFEQKSKLPAATLDKKFSIKIPLVLISESERDRIFMIAKKGEKSAPNMNGFDEFHKVYPKSQGFMSLSRIGYNPERTQALIYVANLCGGLCGTGQYFLLVKDGTTWKVQVTALVWIS